LPRYSRARFHYATTSFVILSLFLFLPSRPSSRVLALACFSLSLSLPRLSPRGSPRPSSFLLIIFFSFFLRLLSTMHADFSPDSQQQRARSRALSPSPSPPLPSPPLSPRRANDGTVRSLYSAFFCTLRYSASINNTMLQAGLQARARARVRARSGAGARSQALSVVLFVRSLLLCCRPSISTKPVLIPVSMVSYTPGLSTRALVNITREYFHARRDQAKKSSRALRHREIVRKNHLRGYSPVPLHY